MQRSKLAQKEWFASESNWRHWFCVPRYPRRLPVEIREDRAVASLCRQIQTWLPYAGAAPPPLPRRALFRLQMAGGGLTGTAYLLRLSLSPTQEDWTEGKEDRRFWLWDALRRPFRLFRKYGSNQ